MARHSCTSLTQVCLSWPDTITPVLHRPACLGLARPHQCYTGLPVLAWHGPSVLHRPVSLCLAWPVYLTQACLSWPDMAHLLYTGLPVLAWHGPSVLHRPAYLGLAWAGLSYTGLTVLAWEGPIYLTQACLSRPGMGPSIIQRPTHLKLIFVVSGQVSMYAPRLRFAQYHSAPTCVTLVLHKLLNH